MTVSEIVREYRKKAGLTQKELAQKTGLAIGTIQQYENNKRIPTSRNSRILSDVLGIDLQHLTNVILEQSNKDPYFNDLFIQSLNKEWRDDWKEEEANFFPEIKDKSIRRLLNAYDTLNDYGKRELVLRAEEMTEVVKFYSISKK